PMAGAMGIVFASLGLVMGLASKASETGSTGLAIGIISLIVVLFTLVDVEFGIYCLVAGMLLSPEIVIPFIDLPSRKVVIRIDDVMIIMVGIAWFAQTAVRGKLDLLVATPLNKPILWFSFLTMLSTARGAFTGSVGHPTTAFFYVLKFMEFFLLYFLIVNTVTTEAQVQRIMTAYFITLLVVALWATWEAVIMKSVGRATTPFETEEEPGTLGGYLLFSFALAFGLVNYATGVMRKVYYLGIMVIIVPPFLYTLSRGSYLAFFPMFISVLLLSRRKMVPIMLMMLFGAASPWLPDVTKERVEYTFQNRIENVANPTFEDQNHVELDPSSAARLERYEGVINQWQYRPLLGQGVTGVGFVDSQFVRVLGEVGILGLLTLFWIFKNLFHTTLRLYRSLPIGYMKGLVLGFIAGAIGLICHGATSNTFTVVRIAGPFWALTGLAVVIYKIHQREVDEREA
ncbi:MAG: O-antigen ligase family protein, partial [Candidatus Hydrogenedentota bacterium]